MRVDENDAMDVAERARAWRRATQADVCDIVQPWAHGTILRATPYPHYYDYNVVRVEDDTAMSVAELAAVADRALAGLAHRRLDFEVLAAAEPLRAQLERQGWRATRLLWMRHQGPVPALEHGRDVEELPYDAVHQLRVDWHRESSPGGEDERYFEHARAVAIGRGARVLAACRDGAPVGFAQVEHDRQSAEITQVYVHADHRARGLGTALTGAAIAAAGETRDLWICADDEDRAKDLYHRLGFRPAATTIEFLRLPQAVGDQPTGG